MRRALSAATAAVLVVGTALAVIAAEIALALRRDFIRTAPPPGVGGTYGPAERKRVRFAVLGDSTAAGLGAGSVDRSYPVLLAERLGEDGFNVELFNFGVAGARTGDVARKQSVDAAGIRPDLVLVAIGGNDVTHLTRLASVRRDMRTALTRLRATGAAVVVTGVPDMRAHAFLEPLRSISGWRGRVVSKVIRSVAAEQNVPFVPLAERTGRFFASDPEGHFSSDLFHPGPGGYRRWAEAIYPALAEAVGAPAGTESGGAGG